MTEKQSSKTVSIRTKEDAEELFKEIAKDFDSQDEAFRSLLAAYDREHKKDDLSEHRDRIENFSSGLKNLERNFLDVLESYKEAKEVAKSSFIDEIENLKKALGYKDSEIVSSKKALEDKDNELKEKAKELEGVRSKADLSDTYKEQIESLKEENKGLRKSLEEYQKQSKEDEKKLIRTERREERKLREDRKRREEYQRKREEGYWKTAWQWLSEDQRKVEDDSYPRERYNWIYDENTGDFEETKEPFYYYSQYDTVEVSEEEYEELKNQDISRFGGWEKIDLEHTDYDGKKWY